MQWKFDSGRSTWLSILLQASSLNQKLPIPAESMSSNLSLQLLPQKSHQSKLEKLQTARCSATIAAGFSKR
jgi:hypothetical protein